MRLYTRGGDRGETSLWAGKRTSKADLRIEAIGSVDELNAYVGLCLATLGDQLTDLTNTLVRCQNNLFALGAELAGASGFRQLNEDDIVFLENEIDRLTDETSPLKSFILPGGQVASAHLHVARTIARRAERRLVALTEKEDNALRPHLMTYLNRLSDLFFVAARAVNERLGTPEENWVG